MTEQNINNIHDLLGLVSFGYEIRNNGGRDHVCLIFDNPVIGLERRLSVASSRNAGYNFCVIHEHVVKLLDGLMPDKIKFIFDNDYQFIYDYLVTKNPDSVPKRNIYVSDENTVSYLVNLSGDNIVNDMLMKKLNFYVDGSWYNDKKNLSAKFNNCYIGDVNVMNAAAYIEDFLLCPTPATLKNMGTGLFDVLDSEFHDIMTKEVYKKNLSQQLREDCEAGKTKSVYNLSDFIYGTGESTDDVL